MTGDAPWWLLAVLIVVSGATIAAVAHDMRRRFPRKLAAIRLIAEAEQACWDADFHTITDRTEQP